MATIAEIQRRYARNAQDLGVDPAATIASYAGAKENILLSPGETWTLEDDLTIPETMTLIGRMGVIETNGFTLTVLGNVDAGHYPLFDISGGGGVVGLQRAKPEWFGADVSGVTSARPAHQATYESIISGGIIEWCPGAIYLMDDDEAGDAYAQATDKNVIVEGGGATIKMAPGTGYIGLILKGTNPGDLDYAILRNVRFFGDKANQNWPDGPNGQDWEADLGNVGALCIWNADFALFDACKMSEYISDGFVARDCETAIMDNCLARDGAELNFQASGKQNTAYKSTRSLSGRFFVTNCECRGGSIGIQMSINTPPGPGTHAVVIIDGGRFYDQAQDTVHMEQCKRIWIWGLEGYGEDADARMHIDIGNGTEYCFISDVHLRYGKIDLGNSSGLIAGYIDRCVVDDPSHPGTALITAQGADTNITSCKTIGGGIDGGRLINCRASAINGGAAFASPNYIRDCFLDNSLYPTTGTVVSNFRGGVISGLTATGGCRVGIKIESSARGISFLSDVFIEDIQEAGLILSDSTVKVKLRDCVFDDYGLAGLTQATRSCIQGPSNEAVFDYLQMHGCWFLRSATGGRICNAPNNVGSLFANIDFVSVNNNNASQLGSTAMVIRRPLVAPPTYAATNASTDRAFDATAAASAADLAALKVVVQELANVLATKIADDRAAGWVL